MKKHVTFSSLVETWAHSMGREVEDSSEIFNSTTDVTLAAVSRIAIAMERIAKAIEEMTPDMVAYHEEKMTVDELVRKAQSDLSPFTTGNRDAQILRKLRAFTSFHPSFHINHALEKPYREWPVKRLSGVGAVSVSAWIEICDRYEQSKAQVSA